MMDPRYCLGELDKFIRGTVGPRNEVCTNHSARYIGMMQELPPTPRPPKKRPAVNKGILFAAVCITTPAVKTIVDVRIPHFLPNLSVCKVRSFQFKDQLENAPAMGAERREPKNVPTRRMDTMSLSSDDD